MNQTTKKTGVATSHLYAWAFVLLISALAILFTNKYVVANTSCAYGNCETVRSVSRIVIPIGTAMFLAGIALLIGSTIRLIIRAIKNRH